MKILVVHCTYRFRGGEDTVVAEEINLLKSKGVEVELLSFNNDRNGLLHLLLLPFNIFSFRRMRKKIREFAPDVVHIHNLHFAASASVIYAAKRSSLPIVMTLHNFRLICPSAILYHNGKLFLDSIESSFPWKAVKRGVYKNSRLLTLWLALSMQPHKWFRTWNKVDRFIVLSEHARALIVNAGLGIRAEQLVIKPNFSPAPTIITSANPPYFLFVGRLSEEKGIRLLLQAFSILNYQVKIAGDGPLKKEVIEAGRECANIEYLDQLNKDEIHVLMANCTALVFPSTWFEGMPLTIIEAFASGTPVIASRLGAMENMVTDKYNGLHFKAGDLHDLVHTLNQWMTNSDEEKAVFKNQAKATYEKYYTADENARQLLLIYNSVRGRNEKNAVSEYPFPEIKDKQFFNGTAV